MLKKNSAFRIRRAPRLARDITEIRPGRFKGSAVRKGHKMRAAVICRLQKPGKYHLYVLEPGPDGIHENLAAAKLANA